MLKRLFFVAFVMLMTWQTVFAQIIDFEDMSEGATPPGWGTDFSSESYANVVSFNGNKYLSIFDNQKNNKYIECYFERQNQRVIIEADIMMDARNINSCCQMAIRSWDDNSAIFVEFRKDSIVQVTLDDGEYTLANEMKSGEWIKCKFDIDIPTKKFNFYLNGELSSVNVPFRKKFANLATLQFTSKFELSEKIRALSIDNINIYTAPREVELIIGNYNTFINGYETQIDSNPNVTPYLSNERTMVPLRYISEAFGASVYYDGEVNTAEVILNDVKLTHKIGTDTFLINGKTVISEASSQILYDRTMVPLRIFMDAFGFDAIYDNGKITITYKN